MWWPTSGEHTFTYHSGWDDILFLPPFCTNPTSWYAGWPLEGQLGWPWLDTGEPPGVRFQCCLERFKHCPSSHRPSGRGALATNGETGGRASSISSRENLCLRGSKQQQTAASKQKCGFLSFPPAQITSTRLLPLYSAILLGCELWPSPSMAHAHWTWWVVCLQSMGSKIHGAVHAAVCVSVVGRSAVGRCPQAVKFGVTWANNRSINK